MASVRIGVRSLARCNLPRESWIANRLFSKTTKAYTTTSGMTEGILLQEVVKQLGKFAPTKLAEKWDNVGLLVEPTGCHKVKKIFLTNDLTQDVLAEAIQKSAEMIISYHPPIFVPLKRLSQGNWKERIITKCIENRIAIFSPHTSYDAIKDGVNDWLVKCFGPGDVQPIAQSFDTSFAKSKWNSCFKVKVLFDSNYMETFIESLKAMEEVLNVNYFYQAVSSMDRSILEVIVIPSEVALAKVYGSIESYGIPYQSEVTKLENLPLPGFGMGRIVNLKEQITIQDAINTLKKHLEISHVRIALARKASLSKKISTVAVCAGSGGSILKGVNADLYVTGELSHHEVLNAVECGRSVILCEHSNSERGFLKTLVPLMKQWFDGEIAVEVSLKDKDPLSVI